MPEAGIDLSRLGREALVSRRREIERRRAEIETQIKGLEGEISAAETAEPARDGVAGETERTVHSQEPVFPWPPRMPFLPDREVEAYKAKPIGEEDLCMSTTSAETNAAPVKPLLERLERLYREADEIGEALVARLRSLVAEESEVRARLRSVEEAIAVRLSGMQAGRGQETASHPAAAPTVEAYRFAHLSRKPVVPVKDSVLDEEIVCLIDGEKRKMLARYLKGRYGMEPDEYKKHFGLPEKYPMTAPGYFERRSKRSREEKSAARTMAEERR